MIIELKAFATLAGYLPEHPERFELPDGTDAAGLLALLSIPPDEVKLIFVNGAKVEPDRVIEPGDRVGLFPAVGGG